MIRNMSNALLAYNYADDRIMCQRRIKLIV